MERIEHLRQRFSISAQTHRRLAFAALVLLVLIVFTGSAVRLTGSGLGCPTWPKCTETSIHSELDTHGVIEFGNRVLTSLVSAGAIAAALGSFLRRPLHPLRRDLAWIGLLLPLGVLVQAVIGGLSVLYKLAPGWVITHYLVSMVLLIASFALWWRSRLEPDQIAEVRSERSVVWAVRALCVYAFVAISVGTWATAAGPHAGSAGTGEFVHRLDFWGRETLSNLINTHGTLAGDPGRGHRGLLAAGPGAQGQRRAAADAEADRGADGAPGRGGHRPVPARAAVGDRLGARGAGHADLGRLRARVVRRRPAARGPGRGAGQPQRPSAWWASRWAADRCRRGRTWSGSGCGFPGVFESTSYGTPALKAKKQGGLMCRLRTDPDALVMRVRDMGEREALLQNGGPAFFTVPHYDGYPYVLIDLDRVDPGELAELVEDAWRVQAPKRTVAGHDDERG